jgi:hypothetical protein
MDDSHIADHYRYAKEHREGPGEIDADALDRNAAHIAAHEQNKQKKLLMNALVGALTSQLARNIGAGQGLQPGGMPLSLQTLQATLGELVNPQPSGQPGQPGQRPAA